MKNETPDVICGCDVWFDPSGGQWHRAVDATPENTPANIADEIAAEILDGGKTYCESFRASNGQYYRWRQAAAE